MVKLLEKVCVVRVKKEDVDFVKKLLPECEKEYSKIMLENTQREYKCKLEMDKHFIDNDWYII